MDDERHEALSRFGEAMSFYKQACPLPSPSGKSKRVNYVPSLLKAKFLLMLYPFYLGVKFIIKDQKGTDFNFRIFFYNLL